MTKYILANWKSHKTLAEAKSWLKEFIRLYRPAPEIKVVIAPPAIHLAPLWQLMQNEEAPNISLAIQDISPFPLGSYTGAVAAAMVRDLVEFAILGHSERRRYFGEKNHDVANKVSEAVAAGITPIICLDESYARAQLTAIDEKNLKKSIIGYGPVEAIGIDTPQSLERVRQVIDEIEILAPHAPILYGGSINEANAADYLKLDGLAGLMVGTASLDLEEFTRICATGTQV